jgi:thiosulfate dehydrogenase
VTVEQTRPRRNRGRDGLIALAVLLALAIGVVTGYFLWGRQPDWYAGHDPGTLPASPENDLIRYGRELVVNTAMHIGPSAADASARLAGNNLACTNCHINAGLEPFAAPFVSTFTSYPLVVDDRYLTLVARINGCMTRSMNGKALPDHSREMDAIVSYIEFVGKGAPQDMRIEGMGLKVLKPAEETRRPVRGVTGMTDLARKSPGRSQAISSHRCGEATPSTLPPA